MSKVSGPVIEHLRGLKSYGEAFDELNEQFPNMDTTQFENLIRSALFMSAIIGRISEQEEHADDE